jgi:hypothetical protein
MSGVARYLVYGLAVLGLYGAAEYRGWSFSGARESRVVPQSVRNNPGSYRPHYYYTGSRRYTGGK